MKDKVIKDLYIQLKALVGALKEKGIDMESDNIKKALAQAELILLS